jgi:hypothetical protein
VSGPLLSSPPVLVEDLPVSIDRDEVLRFQGYKRGVDLPDPVVTGLFAEAQSIAAGLLAPRVVYRAVPAWVEAPDEVCAGDRRLRIPGIARLWGALTHVGIAVCTIGDALERRVAALFEAREFPLAVMLDSIGSAATEHLAESTNDRLCQLGMPLGLRVTNRISPGYAGWDVADQAALFALCPGALAGVHLNDFCFMTPAKTISCMVGIGPDARVDHYFTQCRRCWMRDCAYRRVPSTVSVAAPLRGEM